MAPSVCQNSPKLSPHTVSSTPGGATTHNDAVVISASNASSVTEKSNCDNSINGSVASYKMSCSENSWPQAGNYNKENQRPPVYNPEDYAQSLKKFTRKQSGCNGRSVYDTSDSKDLTIEEDYKSATLPNKHFEYKNPILAPPKSEIEMTLRQFASITDLLTKLRADLRASFPSFVQEFIAMPSDGVSLLLQVLRAIQLSQTTNALMPPTSSTASMPRNAQAYQRRALLDELSCLQCLTVCCTRSVEAAARLGTTPVGLIALASSATGQGIRARVLALQLMSAACDKNILGHGSQKAVTAGHVAVSEAMSTLRLRCSEPVRFRLLVGMLNSGGGSGELQTMGVKFINAFLESAENLQQRLYLQAELFQAGFEPATLANTIAPSSPWLDALRLEIKRFNDLHVDVDKMISQARDADRVRSQMVILERRVQILHEEKAVLTSMERRLQERCAELQREIFRLQGAQNDNFKSLNKQPVALPRHVQSTTAHNKQDSSEHEDEGISSSETGPSLSPVPILVLPQKTGNAASNTQQHKILTSKAIKTKTDDDTGTTIEDVMQEFEHIVHEAEKQMDVTTLNEIRVMDEAKEQDIVPVNIVPQPPRKVRSLAHLVSQAGGSELDGSEYGMMVLQQNQIDPADKERVAALQAFFEETDDYNMPEIDKSYALESADIPDAGASATAYNASTTRELLDVIMNARHTDEDPTMRAFREADSREEYSKHNTAKPTTQRNNFTQSNKKAPVPPPPFPNQPQAPPAPAQQFNGVFFMTGMNTPQKYPKPDITAALQARRVTKNVERLEAAFASQESLNIIDTNHGGECMKREKSRSNQQIYFGNNPVMGVTTGISTGAVIANATQKISSNNHHHRHHASSRTRSYTQGSKVTDTLSGLY